MKQQVQGNAHIKAYLKYGFFAAVAYMIPLVFFFNNHKYQNLYYIYIGTAFFMATIFVFTVRLLSKPYERKRAAAMLISGHKATLSGILFCWIFLLICSFIFFGNIFSYRSQENTLANAPAAMEFHSPAGLLLRLMAVTLLCNFGGGSFISIITSYGGKFNQTKDKPAKI